jgi:carbonic anhydrase
MKSLPKLFENNRRWSESLRAQNPSFFSELAAQQSPQYLWIGCSDSRVPSTQLVDLAPGEMFVHRNVANVVVHTDLNCLSVLQFAVEVLRVRHVIVCGHYGCGGVEAALRNTKLGLIDNWLRHVQDVMQRHAHALEGLTDDARRFERLCELNVIEQVFNVGQTTIIEGAWARGQELTLHGWVYSLKDGLLRDLGVTASSPRELYDSYRAAISPAAS